MGLLGHVGIKGVVMGKASERQPAPVGRGEVVLGRVIEDLRERVEMDRGDLAVGAGVFCQYHAASKIGGSPGNDRVHGAAHREQPARPGGVPVRRRRRATDADALFAWHGDREQGEGGPG